MVRREWVEGKICCDLEDTDIDMNYYIEGEVSGVMYTEDQTYTEPMHTDVEMDVSTLSIKVDMWKNKGYGANEVATYTSKNAIQFLESVGFDDTDIEWEINDEH